MKYIVSCIVVFILFMFTSHNIVAQDTIHVDAGWNMIGALSTEAISTMRTEPDSIIISYYFGFTPSGYTATDTLNKAKGYWIRTSQAGILIGGTPSGPSCGEVVVYGGRGYNTVKIGTQCWFAQNLDIGEMVIGGTVQSNNGTIEKYCYNNDSANCTTYGGFYHWDEVMKYSTVAGTQGICPTGWHVPTYGEFQTLQTSVNNDGDALKAVGQGIGDGVGTNTSGFSALISGYCYNDGYYSYSQNINTYFWSSTKNDETSVYYAFLRGSSNVYDFSYNTMEVDYSLRCLKD